MKLSFVSTCCAPQTQCGDLRFLAVLVPASPLYGGFFSDFYQSPAAGQPLGRAKIREEAAGDPWGSGRAGARWAEKMGLSQGRGSVPWGQAEWRPAGRTVAPSPHGTTRPGQCRRLGAPRGASPGPLGSPHLPKLGCASLTSPRIWGLSLQGAPREEVHYSSVVFNTQSQDSEDTAPRQRPWPQEPEYSVIRKT